jgi:C4-dicarboxylate transporter DctM subunit
MLLIVTMVLLAGVLLVAGVPMAFSVGLSAVVVAFISGVTPVQVLTVQMFDTSTSFLLIAIPLFVFASAIMAAGGLASDLIRLAELIVGRIRGGLGVAVVGSSMLFSGMTGAKVAEIAAIAQTTVPSLKNRRYDANYATTIVLAGSAAGELVPPAINMIIVGEVLNTSVTKLFVGSLIPAVFLGFLVSILVVVKGSGRTVKAAESPSEIGAAAHLSESSTPRAIVGGLVAAGLPLLVFGGILRGIFSPTEAAGIACLYAMLVVGVVYRRLRFMQLVNLAADSAVLSGALMLLVISAAAFSQMLSIQQLQFRLTADFAGLGNSQVLLIVVTILLFVIMGSVLEGLPAVIIFAPVLAPIAEAAGMDLTHFGVLIVAAIGLGLCLPPVGIGFVTACAVSDTKSAAVTKRYLPFVAILLIGVLAIGFIPQFSTFLPSHIH